MHTSLSAAARSTRFLPLRRVWRWAGLLGFAAAAFAASEPSLITGQKKSFGYSWQQELQLGAEADKEMVDEMGLYEDPPLQAYVQAVGERVLQHSNFNAPNTPELYRNTKFTFRVMDSPVVNAFALPGGYVYVTRGLLAHLDNEAQLAVVLGHEIAHVAARHSSQQAQRSKWTQLGVIAGAILGQKVLGERMPDVGQTILGAGGQAMQMFMLRYSREAEFESDNLGVSYATAAGYNAATSARFFKTLQQLSSAEGKALPAWQSTHPDPGDRAGRVVQIAQQANPQRAAGHVGQDEYLRRIENLVLGEDPRAGFAENGTFYHPVLRFQMPVAPGWKLENQRAAVVMAEPNGAAMMGLRLAPGARARDAAINFAQQNKVQVAASGDTTINGLPASVLVGQANSEAGALGVWNAFIEMDGKVYSILGYAPAPVFERMRPTFEGVAAGFSPLRAPQIAGVQPTRLKVVRADRPAPFAAFVPTSLPPELKAEQVALLNQLSLDEPVPQGALLKIPETPPRPRLDAAPGAGAPPYPPGNSGVYRGPNSPAAGYPEPNRQPAGNPPPANVPPPGYPPPGNYPGTSYPHPGYPGAGSTYPPPPGYPPQSYPPPAYPPSPGNYPAPTSPPPAYPNGGYPPAQPYPPATTYPSNSYPPPGYPAPPPPQFPQPGQTPPPSPRPSPPPW